MTPDPLASELLRLDAQADRCLARARRHGRHAIAWGAVESLATLVTIAFISIDMRCAALVALTASVVAAALAWRSSTLGDSRAQRAHYLTGRMSGLVAAATAPDAAVGRRSVIVRAAWDAARKGAAS